MSPLDLDIQLNGKPAHVVLALLPWSRVVQISIVPDRTSHAFLPGAFEDNVFWSVATIDGIRRTTARSKTLAADPAAVAAIFAKRYDIYMQLRAAGRMYAQCPHCKDGEIEMSLLSLFDLLGAMPPEMISADFAYFLSPVSNESTPFDVARPSSFTYASQIRFVLPSELLGLPRSGFTGGVVGRASHWRAEPAWQRWETDGINVPLGHAWRQHDHAAFQTTIWLIAALRSIDPPGEITLEAFEQLPAVDVYFLDAIYRLAFDTSVPAHAQPRTCPRCAGTFIPVADLVHEHGPPSTLP